MKYILSLILLFAFTNAVQTQTINQWDIQNVTGSTLKFKNGKTFNTRLYQLKYIGQISNGTNAPFFIFSGRDCDDCDENISIYIHSPANGKISIERGQNRYEYPGNEKDYEKNTLVSKSSAYYGQVLKNTIGIIWYKTDLLNNGKWVKSIFLVKINHGIQKDTMIVLSHQLDETKQLCKTGVCKEIKGLTYATEP